MVRRDEPRLTLPRVSHPLAKQFRESVVAAMQIIMGDQVASLVYYHARVNYGVDVSQLPSRLKEFDRALTGLLGSGARIVTKECAKRLTASLGVSIEPFPDDFTGLYRKASESLRLEKWISPLELIAH